MPNLLTLPLFFSCGFTDSPLPPQHTVSALLVPCQTPASKTVVFGVLQNEQCAPNKTIRDCAAWKTILSYAYACQPGAPLLEADPQNAILFWLEEVPDPKHLAGTEAAQAERWQCDGTSREMIDGLARIESDEGGLATVNLELEEISGPATFTVCR
ncbi:MAG: hypothetical protein AAFV53_05340 [Myxococcota bacterium]